MLFVKAIVRMGLDIADKLLCYFALAMGNDGLTHETSSRTCQQYIGQGKGCNQSHVPAVHPKGQDLSAYCLGHCKPGRCHLTTPINMLLHYNAHPRSLEQSQS